MTTEHLNRVVAIDTGIDAVVAEVPLSTGHRAVALSPDGQTAYTADLDTDTLAVIDLKQLKVVRRIPVGRKPRWVAVSSDGSFAYVVGEPTVKVDLPSGQVTPIPSVTGIVHRVVISGDDRFAYVDGSTFRVENTPQGPSAYHYGLFVIDTTTQEVTLAAEELRGDALVLSPDGRRLYLLGNRPGRSEGRIVVVDTSTLKIVLDVLVDSYPLHELAIHPNGSTLYAWGGRQQSTYVLDAATLRVRATNTGRAVFRAAISPDGKLYLTNAVDDDLRVVDTTGRIETVTIHVGTEPTALTISPDGQRVYVAALDGLYIVDTTTNAILDSVPGGADPTGIAATPDGRFLYVANNRSGSVAVIDVERRELIESIATGGMPFGVAITPDGSRAYVTSFEVPGKVFVIDTASNTQIGTVDVPGEGAAVAITPDGKSAFVSSYYWDGLSKIDVATGAVVHKFVVINGASGVAIAADGSFGIVGSELPAALQFFDPYTFPAEPLIRRTIVVDAMQGEAHACSVVLSRDGRRAHVVVGEFGAEVFAVDMERGIVSAETPINVPYVSGGCGLALSNDEHRLYVANNDNDLVTVVDTSDNRILHHIPVPPRPWGIAITCLGGCPSPTPTATPTATPTRTPTRTPLPCYGDCNRDGTVTIAELITAIGMVLDAELLSVCDALDRNSDGSFTLDEVVAAVGAALIRCGPLADRP